MKERPARSSICSSCQGILENGVCPACLLGVGLQPAAADSGDAAELDFSDIPDGTCRLDGYELLEEIGRGGMGVIYRARQPLSNRLVALKRLLPAQNTEPDTAHRLRREAEAVASLDHPHILPVFEVGTDEEGLPFFSMKLAARGSLAQNRPRLEGRIREIAALVAKIARAVQYAHEQGILHRDLKPGNILLDGNGEPMVADFGLAKWLDRPSDLTRSLTVFGTPGYLAPEQASLAAKDLGFAADIYSLGAILFDLLAGRPPFVGENAWSVVQRAAQEKAPALRSLRTELDRDLETICARCLEREPAARYKKAGDLAADLQRWLDGRPILARPVSLPETAWRWARRNRWLTFAGVFCFGLAFWGLWHLAESRRLSHLVETQNQSASAIRLLPIFDMDAASYRSAAAVTATSSIEQCIQKSGRLLKIPASGTPWTRDFPTEARETGAPFLIAGTTRKVAGGDQVVLHWFDAREGRFTRRISGVSTAGKAEKVRFLISELLAGRGEPDPSHAAAIASNQEARDLIAAGDDYLSRYTVESFDQAILCGKKAVAADPRSARAYANLSLALSFRGFFGQGDRAGFQKEAQQAVAKAVELAPRSAAVLWAQTNVAFFAFRLEECQEATRSYLEASMDIAKAAKQSGMLAKYLGQSSQALVWFRLSRTFSNRQETLALEGDVLSDLGLEREAAASYQTFDNLFPDQPDGRLGLCELDLLRGDFEAGRDKIRGLAVAFPTQLYSSLIAGQEAFYARDYPRAAELYGKMMATNRQGGSFFYGSISFLAARGHSLVATGQVEEGETLLREAREHCLELLKTGDTKPDEWSSLAATEAALGNTDASLEILRKNLTILAPTHCFLERDPRFDTIRSDPRFQEILQTMTRNMEILKQEVLAQNTPSPANL